MQNGVAFRCKSKVKGVDEIIHQECRQEGGGRDGGGGELLEKALVGARVRDPALVDVLTTVTAGAEKIETDEGDEDQGGEEVDHQQVSNESGKRRVEPECHPCIESGSFFEP